MTKKRIEKALNKKGYTIIHCMSGQKIIKSGSVTYHAPNMAQLYKMFLPKR